MWGCYQRQTSTIANLCGLPRGWNLQQVFQPNVCLSLLFISPLHFSNLILEENLNSAIQQHPSRSEQIILAIDICNMPMHTHSLRGLIKDLLFIPQIHLPLLESPTGLVERLFEESFETFFSIPDGIYSLLFLSKQECSCVLHGCTCSFSNKRWKILLHIIIFLLRGLCLLSRRSVTRLTVA